MDSFNKVISFVLGLVVVLVFFAVVTGKLNFKNKTLSTLTSNSTPTSTQKPPLITTGTEINNVYKQNSQVVGTPSIKSIPSTGLPTLFVPILLSGLAGGNLLRKIGKK